MRRISPLLETKIKNEILGRNYELSVAYVGLAESLRLNKKYRKKNKPANVLSFPLSASSGEIVLCPPARGEFSLGFLLIHGMLHLKGMKHSSRMEKAETEYDKKYFDRNRHRLVHDQSRGRRIHKRRKTS